MGPARYVLTEGVRTMMELRQWVRLMIAGGLVLVMVAGVAIGNNVGGFMRFTYRTEAADGLVETIAIEIIPTAEGGYRVITTTEQHAGSDEIRISVFGASHTWLGLHTGDDRETSFSVAALNALADEGLEPHRQYLLPDGGMFRTGARVSIAGVPGIEGVYTHTGAENVTITVVIPDDPDLRHLLPFPLLVRVEHEEDESPGTEEPEAIFFSGTIELVEFTRTQEEGAP